MRGARRAFITGMGCISPHGAGIAAFEAGLRTGRTATRTITLFPADELPCRVAGEVPDFDPAEHVSRRDRDRIARVVPMALVAAREALASAGLDPDDCPGNSPQVYTCYRQWGRGARVRRTPYPAYSIGPRGVSRMRCRARHRLLARESPSHSVGSVSHVLSNGCTFERSAGLCADQVRATRDLPRRRRGWCTRRVLAGYQHAGRDDAPERNAARASRL